MVADKSRVECRGWQTDGLAPVPAGFVRFRGLHNAANSPFQVVQFEVYP